MSCNNFSRHLALEVQWSGPPLCLSALTLGGALHAETRPRPQTLRPLPRLSAVCAAALEPSWHRNLRKNRSRLRARVKKVRSSALGKRKNLYPKVSVGSNSPSLLEREGISQANPQIHYDVVLWDMSHTESTQCYDVQRMLRTLDPSVAQEDEISQQGQTAQASRRLIETSAQAEIVSARRRQSGHGTALTGTGSLDCFNAHAEIAINKGRCVESGRRVAIASTPGVGTSAKVAARGNGHQPFDKRRGIAQAFEGHLNHGGEPLSRTGGAEIDPRAEGAFAEAEQSFVTWSSEQCEAPQGEGCISGPEDQGNGPGMEYLRPESDKQVPAPFDFVSSCQTRSNGSIQCKAPRAARAQETFVAGIPSASGARRCTGNAGSPRDNRAHGQLAEVGSLSRPDTDLRPGFRRGRSRGSGRHRYSDWRAQGREAQGDKLQRLAIAQSCGKSDLEGQEGQDCGLISQSNDCFPMCAWSWETFNIGSNKQRELLQYSESERQVPKTTCSKVVRFATEVELCIWHHDESSNFKILCASMHRWLRHFWEIQGDTCSWTVMREMKTLAQKVPWTDLGLGDRSSVFHFDSSSHEVGTQDQCRPDAGDIPVSSSCHRLHELLQSKVSSQLVGSDQPSLYVETWLVSELIPMCPVSRQVELYDGDSWKDFERRCRRTWQDLGQDVLWDFHLVRPMPPSERRVVTHIIIAQSLPIDGITMMIKHEGLSPLRKHRAVLYRQGSSVFHILQVANCHRPCSGRQTVCRMQSVADQEIVYDTKDRPLEESGAYY